jgi:hypothetical protein
MNACTAIHNMAGGALVAAHEHTVSAWIHESDGNEVQAVANLQAAQSELGRFDRSAQALGLNSDAWVRDLGRQAVASAQDAIELIAGEPNPQQGREIIGTMQAIGRVEESFEHTAVPDCDLSATDRR